jgi:hypothetical protein
MEPIQMQCRPRGLQNAVLVFVACAFALFCLLIWVFSCTGNSHMSGQPVGLWLCAATGVILLLPSAYLFFQHRFDFFHPLVFPVYTYLLPAFVLGGVYVLTGISTPWVLDLVTDPGNALCLSLVYVLVGFAGLTIGFALPLGQFGGKLLSRKLPGWIWKGSEVQIPAVILVSVGILLNFWAIAVGVGGYQTRRTVESEGGLVYSLTVIGSLGSFILWYVFFQCKKRRLLMYVVMLFPLGQILINMLSSGSRSAVLVSAISIFAAYRFSGRRVSFRNLLVFLCIGVIALLIGFSVGTTYREIKGTEGEISGRESLEIGVQAIRYLANQAPLETAVLAGNSFLGRFETLSSLGVIVARYKDLAPLEGQYGIANNIWTYTWTALIPRFIWANKPLISDARAVGALYYNYPENSFGMTVFGDLLRNFGPVGVPIGMLLLGMILRILFVAFSENRGDSVWRSASYFFILSTINYEGFYGSIFPGVIRLSVGLLVGGVLVNTMIRFRRFS